jgi:mycothiol synthase
VRRLTLEPDPEIVAPELADAIERVLDERRPADELAARLREVAERSAAAGGDAITLEAEPAPDALDRACRSIGFDLVRTMLQLRRPLPLPAEWPRPETPRLRSFRPGRDEQAWLDVNHRAFEWHPEQGDWTLADLRQRESEPWFRPEGFLVLDGDAGDDEDGVEPRLDGFCWAKVHDEDPPLGEIYVIGVDPDRHGLGLGRALVLAGLDWLTGQGIRHAMLYVEGDNAPALHLYRDLGFVEHVTHRWWRRNLTATTGL